MKNKYRYIFALFVLLSALLAGCSKAETKRQVLPSIGNTFYMVSNWDQGNKSRNELINSLRKEGNTFIFFT